MSESEQNDMEPLDNCLACGAVYQDDKCPYCAQDSKPEEQRDKTLGEIYDHVVKCLPFASAKAKHQQGLEAVAAEAVRRAGKGILEQYNVAINYIGELTGHNAKQAAEIAKQAELIRVLVEALKRLECEIVMSGYVPESYVLLTIKKALRKAEGVL